MNCSNCDQPIEAGAAFCGNCGQPILQHAVPVPVEQVAQTDTSTRPASPVPASSQAPPVHNGAETSAPTQTNSPGISEQPATPIAQVYANQAAPTSYPGDFVATTPVGIPTYAVPIASQQSSELKAEMSLVVGILGTVGAFFIPLVGLALGVGGIVLASLSLNSAKRRLGMVGLIISSLAVLIGLAAWAYTISHDARLGHKIAKSTAPTISGSAVSSQQLSTPCYSINFASILNIQNNSGSCNMNAYNGATLDNSTEAYKVYGTVSAVTNSNFTSFAKQAIEKDIAESLPGFRITHENSGQFADSPAYFVTASSGAGVTVMEAIVTHQTTNGDNFFVFVHAVNAKSVNLNVLQAGWQWQ